MQIDRRATSRRHILAIILIGLLSMIFLAASSTPADATTFSVTTKKDTSMTPTALAVGDVNSDGRDDVVTANFNGNSISVFLQETSGTLTDAITYTLLPTDEMPITRPGMEWLRTHPSGVVIADMDGDGHNDVVVSDQWYWSLYYFQQDNPLSYTDPLDDTPDLWQPHDTYATKALVQPVDAVGTPFGEVELSHPDAFAYRFYFDELNLNQPGDRLQFIDSAGVVQYEYVAPVSLEDEWTPWFFTYRDDIMKVKFVVTADPPASTSTWTITLYQTAQDYKETHPFSQPYSLAAGDLLEHVPGVEVVSSNYLNKNFEVFKVFDGQLYKLSAPRDLQENIIDARCYGVAVGDLNYDLTDDFAMVGWDNGNAIPVRQSSTGWFIHNTALDFAVGQNPFAVAIGDVNQDRRNDIVATAYGEDQVTVAIQNTAGYFFKPVNFQTGPQPMGVTVADVTADGANDIIVANSHGNSIGVFTQNTSQPGIFSNEATFPAGWYPYSVGTGDLDGDGGTEIVVTNSNDDNIAVLQPTPQIVWSSPASGARVRGTINPAVVAPSGTGIDNVRFSMDSLPRGTVYDAPYAFALDTALESDGTHTLTATADDGCGHTYTTSRSFVSDNTKPVVSYISAYPNPFYPIRRDGYKDNCSFKFKSSEAGSIVLRIYYSGRLIKTLTQSARAGWNTVVWDGRWSSGRRVVGNYTYRVYVKDAAGNVGYSTVGRVSVRLYVLVRVGSNKVRLVPH
ncbi:MAG: hypothetical protein C4521_08860 [Actinobacteria bacterium]|nr:MAG: hypothetical protein C4521_08860 [Actinomycetota bacterium]